jgi:GH24 family phage-related lysozyme (muramidase)
LGVGIRIFALRKKTAIRLGLRAKKNGARVLPPGVREILAAMGAHSESHPAGDMNLVDVKTLHLSESGVRFVAALEGVVLHPYNDSKGYATVGIGHLIDYRKVTEKDKADWAWLNTNEKAYKLFAEDIAKKYEPAIRAAVKVKVSQAQFDAMVSFAYNVGTGNAKKGTGFRGSMFLKELNAGHYNGEMLLRFRKPVDILIRRRNEVGLFTTGVYNFNPYNTRKKTALKKGHPQSHLRAPEFY